MALSDVAIANRGLQLLGARRIEALEENSPNGRSMNIAYVPVRDALMREYAWNFAIKRVSVAADATKTTYGNLNRYALPTDYARLLRNAQTSGSLAYSQGTSPTDIRHDWQIEGDFIVTADSAPLEFRYLARITDPTLFDSMFDEALAVALALETCEEVTQSNVKVDRLERKAAGVIALAKRTNSIENDADVPLEDDWVLVRL